MTKNIAVIGAGVGGLVCANILAKNLSDYKIILIEQHNKVGGLAQSWRIKPKLPDGRKVDVACELTHAIAAFHEGAHYHNLYTALGVDWNNVGKFKPAPRFVQFITPNSEPLILFNTFEENLKYLNDKFPEEKKGIEGYFNYLHQLDEERSHAPGFKKTLEDKVAPFFEKLPPPFRFAGQAAVLSITKPTFVRYRNYTLKDILDKFFQTDGIKTYFSALYGYTGLPPSRVSGNFQSLVHVSYWEDGGPQAPVDNSFQAMHDELARVLEEIHGGELRLNSAMEEIIVENNKAAGIKIKTKRGEEYILNADCVIVAGDPKKMLLPLRGYLPKDYVKKLEGYEMSVSLLGTHVLTDLPLHEMREKLSYAANVLCSSPETIERGTGSNFPDEYTIYVNVPTVLRPNAGLIKDMAGNPIKDLHIVDMVMRSPPYGICKFLRDKDREAYRAFKADYAKEIIRITDKMLIPGLSNRILNESTYTAATHERFCSTTEGAVYNIAPTVAQFAPNRPSPKTPINGLYLTGAAVLSAGVGGAIFGGELTSKCVLEHLKR